MKLIIFITALLYSNYCSAQFIRSPLSVGYIGIGTYSRNFTDAFSFTNNQAALSQVKEVMAGIYAERRFMLKELNLLSSVFALPFQNGAAGITAIISGSKNYSQSQIGLAYGRSLGETLSLGVQFNYNLIRIPGYGNTAAIGFEIGSIIRLTEKMQAGCHIYNLLGGKWDKEPGKKLAAIYTIGLGYDVSEKLFTSTQIEKEENQPVNVNVTMHYEFVKQFFVRGGIASESDNTFLGVGLKWQNLRMDFIATWHRHLGLTPALLIIFNLPQSKKSQ